MAPEPPHPHVTGRAGTAAPPTCALRADRALPEGTVVAPHHALAQDDARRASSSSTTDASSLENRGVGGATGVPGTTGSDRHAATPS